MILHELFDPPCIDAQYFLQIFHNLIKDFYFQAYIIMQFIHFLIVFLVHPNIINSKPLFNLLYQSKFILDFVLQLNVTISNSNTIFSGSKELILPMDPVVSKYLT